MKLCYLDFETASEVDLQEVGLDNYARHPSTRALLLAYAIDNRKIKLWRIFAGETMPEELAHALLDSNCSLIAHNAQFERVIFHRVLRMRLNFSRWRDTMALAYSWSLPGKLEKIGPILKFAPENCKTDFDPMFFSAPVSKGGRETLFGIEPPLFRTRESHPKEWAQFEAYNIQDVHAERYLWEYLTSISPLPELEWRIWALDQKINEFGMPVNRQMAVNGLEIAKASNKELVDWLKEKTGLENPASPDQIKKWISTRGYTRNSIQKEFVKEALDNPNSAITPECREVLEVRQEAAKKSYTKLERLLQVMGPDNRVRYQFRFGGAARTLRWAGGDVQTQNLSRPTKEVKKNYQQAIDLIMEKAYDKIKKLYPSVVGMVVGSLRMNFQVGPGKKMVVCDLNAVENRVLGFLARCPGILEVFDMDQDPYIAFGSKLYKISYEDMLAEYQAGKEERRTNSKPAVLGAGYGLGAGVARYSHYDPRLKEMIASGAITEKDMQVCEDFTYVIQYRINQFKDKVKTGLLQYAANMGIELTPEEAYNAQQIFRQSYPEVVQYWHDLEEAFKHVLRTGKPIRVGEVTWDRKKKKWMPCEEVVEGTVIEFDRVKLDSGYMIRIHLPSDRYLHYLNATLEEETVPGNEGKPWTRTQIYYDGIEHSATQNEDGSTAKKKAIWTRVKTYGGKICENVDQAFSRDLLSNGMLLADAMMFLLFGMFHDELAAEVDDDEYGLGINDLRQCMSEAPSWAPSIPLGAEGFESTYYRK